MPWPCSHTGDPMNRTLLFPALLLLHSAAAHAAYTNAIVDCLGTSKTSGLNPAVVTCNWDGLNAFGWPSELETSATASGSVGGNVLGARIQDDIGWGYPQSEPGPINLRAFATVVGISDGPERSGIATISMMRTYTKGGFSQARIESRDSGTFFSTSGAESCNPIEVGYADGSKMTVASTPLWMGACQFTYSMPVGLGVGTRFVLEMGTFLSLSEGFSRFTGTYGENYSFIDFHAEFFEADGTTPVRIYDAQFGIPAPTPEPGTLLPVAVVGVIALAAQRRLQVV